MLIDIKIQCPQNLINIGTGEWKTGRERERDRERERKKERERERDERRGAL